MLSRIGIGGLYAFDPVKSDLSNALPLLPIGRIGVLRYSFSDQ